MKSSKSAFNNEAPDGPSSAPASPIITLTTDFGLSDYFVGALKGVILQKCANVRIVDITHNLPHHDVISAAFVIKEVFQYYPPGAIHMIVVDPGVGTERRKIIVHDGGQSFLAPDNGILSYVLNETGSRHVYEILEKAIFLSEESPTFAGRDHFAPIAASLVNGASPDHLGREIVDPMIIQDLFPIENGSEYIGRIVYFDQYGNAITNLTKNALERHLKGPKPFTLEISGNTILKGLKKNYSEGEEGRGNLILNSSGHLEIFFRKENAKTKLKLKLMDKVIVY